MKVVKLKNDDIYVGAVPSSVRGFFNAKMTAHAVCSEMIDNSLDAEADVIHIYIDNNKVSFVDNGNGINDIGQMFTIGSSGSKSDMSLIGQYGVGGKYAALRVGKKVSVTSRHREEDDLFIEHAVDWEAVSKMKRWPTHKRPDYTTIGKLNDKVNSNLITSGWNTAITISKRHTKGLFYQMGSLANALANTYRPALQRDVEIILHSPGGTYDLSDQQSAFPEFDRGLERQLRINGKKAHLTAGVCDKHIPHLTGALHVSFINRVIESRSVIHETSIPPQMYMSLELGEEWKFDLGTLKDTVEGDDAEALMEEVWEACRELIEQVKSERTERKMLLKNVKYEQRLRKAIVKTKKKGTQLIVPGDTVEVRVPTPSDTPPNPNPDNPTNTPVDVDPKGGKDDFEEHDKPAPDDDNIEFSIASDPALGELMVDVECTDNGKRLKIEVSVNPESAPIAKAYDEYGDSLEILVANAMAGYFASEEGRTFAIGLFGPKWYDDSQAQHVNASVLLCHLLEALSPTERVEVNEKEVDI